MNKKIQQIVLITGVSSGIGRALALEFRTHGFCVAGVCRSKPDIPLDLWIKADVTNPADRKLIAKNLNEKFGTLDLLVNNAGKGAYSVWEELKEDELRGLFELDFFAPVALTMELLDMLKKSKGTVVNISSAAGRIWVPCMGAYCAAKAALSMFSNSLRPELKGFGIRVIDLAPGQISTGFSSRSFGTRQPPDAPGAKKNGPAGLAHAVYRKCVAGMNGRATYPCWLGFAIGLVRNFIPGIYDRVNRRLWKLR